MALFQFLFRRMTRHWQMLLTVSLGVLLATALLASAPLLVDTVVAFGLQHTLHTADPLTRNLLLSARTSPDPDAVADADALVGASIQSAALPVVDTIIASLESNWLFPWPEDVALTDQRVNARVYEDVAAHVSFVDGHWPDAAHFDGETLPVVIGEEMAHAYGLSVGSELPLSFKRDADQPDVWMRVAGIVRPLDMDDPYWFGQYGPLHAESSGKWVAQYNVLVSAPEFYDVAQAWFPRASLILRWHVVLDADHLTFEDIAPLRKQIVDFGLSLKSLEPRITQSTQLPEVLEKFAAQADVVRVPLYLLTAEIVLLALYYVVMVSALSVQQVAGELAVLGSRGASRGQVLVLQLTEALILSIVALLSGPGLGALLVRGLGIVGPLADVQTARWSLSLTQSAWLAAGAGALASLLGLLLPVGPMLRRTVVSQTRAAVRSGRAPWWQRLYLDVFVAALGVLLLWRLQLYGGIVAEGGTRLDWLLLFSPLALLLGAATILLRVFPLMLRVLSIVMGEARGLVPVLATWPAARNPAHVARLVLLLTLAMALGILATGLNATLDASERERAAYTTGGDARLSVNQFVSSAQVVALPGVDAATSVWRGSGSVNLGRTYTSFDLLAIDPETVAELAKFREDFAASPVPDLLPLLEQDVPNLIGSETLILPGQPASVGVWLWSPSDEMASLPHYDWMTIVGQSNHERITLRAKLRTAGGEFILVDLHSVMSDGCTFGCWGREDCNPARPWEKLTHYYCPWRYFTAALPALPDTEYPLTLETFWIQNRTRGKPNYQLALRSIGQVFIMLAMDDISVVDRMTGETTVLEDFESPSIVWTQSLGVTKFAARGGHDAPARQDILLPFTRVAQAVALRPYTDQQIYPIPVLVSPVFLETAQLQTGDIFHAWIEGLPDLAFRVVGGVTYFPTLYDDAAAQEGFVIASNAVFLPRINYLTRKAINPNELWTQGRATSSDLVSQIPGVTQHWDLQIERQIIKAHPMTLGLRSVTFFGYVLTSVLSLVGFGTYFYMSARQRSTLYGVLRAMGLSAAQLYASLVGEQVVLILWGLGLGTGLGLLLNQLVLPGLPISLGDRLPVPPFIPRDDWGAVWQLYAILGGAFLLVLGIAVMALWRSKLHRALRIGQE